MAPETKNCQNCKKDFVIELDDFGFYEKIKVPSPINCPQCRQKRRILFRNFKTLYKRPSSKSGKPLVSMYSSKVAFPVWSSQEWWSDDWDPKGFGRDVDFTKPMFSQIKALWDVVPRYAVLGSNSINCDYSNAAFNSKNCYLVFGGIDNEDCMYGHITWNSKECVDCLYVFKSETCYECIDVLGSNKLLYSQECEDCSESVGLYNCKSCVNCIGCVGLRSKSYCIFNEQVTKEQYQQFLKEHSLNDPATIKMISEKRDVLRRELPARYFNGSHNVDVSGDHIYNGKNLQYAFDVKSGENSSYLFTVRRAIDSSDISFTGDVEQSYMCLNAFGQRIFFSHSAFECSDVYYSDNCYSCHNIFACAGLRNAEYCILNKQYAKEEYEALLPKLVAHMKSTSEWGQFFSREISPFAYNESIVNEYYPLTKEQALTAGYRWEDDIPMTVGSPTKTYTDLPKDPAQYSPDLVKETLACKRCKRNYRLTPQEIDFYKKMKLHLPAECFNCRHQQRMDSRNRRELWPGKCAQCEVEFMTSYSPDQHKQYKIFCETCYLKTI